MIDYAGCSIAQLEEYLAIEQKLLDSNPLDASANARWRQIVLLIKRKDTEQLFNIKRKSVVG